MEIDKAVKVFSSDLSANKVWRPAVNDVDRILIFLKYISNFIHKSVRIATNVVNKGKHVISTCCAQYSKREATTCNYDALSFTGTGKISLLSLLGFDNTTPVAIFHDQLPYILATLLNGISDPVINEQIVKALESDTEITCSMMYDWLSDDRVGLSATDYRTLKNFTCDFDPENFNAYTDLYMAEMMIWEKPAKQYRSYLLTMISDLYGLAEAISLAMKNNITIQPPFSKQYLDSILPQLKETLEIRHARGTFRKVNN